MNYLGDIVSSLSLDDVWGHARHPWLRRADDLLGEALSRVGAGLLLPWTLLTLLTWVVSGSPTDVAITAILASLAWQIPQTIPRWMLTVPNLSFPVLAGSALVRLASIFLLAILLLRSNEDSGAGILAPFWACLVAFLLTDSFIRLNRHRNDSFGILHAVTDQHRVRAPYVTLAAIVFCGLVVTNALGNTDVTVIHAAGLIALASAAVTAAGTWFLLRTAYLTSRTDETRALLTPTDEATISRPSISGRGGRRLIVFRALIGVSALADPFLIVYALERLNIPVRFAGIYAILFALAACATVMAVPRSARRVSSRKVLQVAALVRFLVPLVALTLALFGDTHRVRDAMSHNAAGAWLFGVTFLVVGLGRGLIAAGVPPYAEGLLPEGAIQRVAQISTVALAVASLAPLLGAWAWNARGMQAMLLVAAIAGFAALLVSGSLAKSRTIGVKRRTRDAR